MPRRKVSEGPNFVYEGRTYRINTVDTSGVYVNIMDAICEQLLCAFSKGRWSLVHIRYVLEDGATNRMFLDQMKTKFKKYVRCLWVIEESKQEAAQFHYHMMLLIEARQANVTRARYALMEIKQKGVIKSYRRIPPDASKIPADLRARLSSRELKETISRFGLLVKNKSALKFGIYWMSYLAKVNTKPVGEQRNYGQTKVPSGWRDSIQRELPFDQE